MPLRTFECEQHGQFRRVVVASQHRAQCPACGKFCGAGVAHPSSPVRVSVADGERAPLLTEAALDVRVKGMAEQAWEESRQRRAQRQAAEAALPEGVRQQLAAEAAYREKLQAVIEDEPLENLDAANLRVWRRSDKLDVKIHEEKGDGTGQ